MTYRTSTLTISYREPQHSLSSSRLEYLQEYFLCQKILKDLILTLVVTHKIFSIADMVRHMSIPDVPSNSFILDCWSLINFFLFGSRLFRFTLSQVLVSAFCVSLLLSFSSTIQLGHFNHFEILLFQ